MNRYFRFSSLRYRLTLLLVGLAIIPIVIVSLILGQRLFNSLEDDALDARRARAQLFALEVQQFFASREAEVERLDKVQRLLRQEQVEQEILLNNLMAYEGVYQEIAILNAEGQEQVKVLRGEIVTADDLLDRSGDGAFQAALSSESTYLSPVAFDPVLREPVFSIAVPFVDLRTSEIAVVVIAKVRFKPIWDRLAALDFEAGEDLYITDAQGKIVAHSNPSIVLSNRTLALPEQDGRGTGLSGETVLIGRDSIFFGAQELVVVSEKSLATALSPATDSLILTAQIAAGVLLVAIALVILVARWVAQPIEQLSKSAKKVAEGDYAIRATVTRQDEFGELADSFNQMAQAVQVRDEEIRQKAEHLAAALNAAEESSRLKSEFLATMSHELRTPMNAIEGFTSIMLDKMGGVEYNEKAGRYLGKVHANSQRLLSLINDFLDLSRIESGRYETARLPLSPFEMAKRWGENLGVLAEQKGLDLKIAVDPALPQVIYGDEESISKIAINLIGNAVKFTETGSVTVSLGRTNGLLELEVQDTGIGIPIHAREFIFDEFRQVDQSSTRLHGGTGLGLAIVQKLARAMGGTVTLSSEVGVGSTFKVQLPLNTEKQPG